MNYPKRYTGDQAPAAVRELVSLLVPQLIAGSHPASSALREQFGQSRIDTVELSGVGVFVEFSLPSDVTLAHPGDLSGGSAQIAVQGLEHGAGCLLFVRGGKLTMFEAFSYDEPWPENTRVMRIENVIPIDPGAAG